MCVVTNRNLLPYHRFIPYRAIWNAGMIRFDAHERLILAMRTECGIIKQTDSPHMRNAETQRMKIGKSNEQKKKRNSNFFQCSELYELTRDKYSWQHNVYDMTPYICTDDAPLVAGGPISAALLLCCRIAYWICTYAIHSKMECKWQTILK